MDQHVGGLGGSTENDFHTVRDRRNILEDRKARTRLAEQ